MKKLMMVALCALAANVAMAKPPPLTIGNVETTYPWESDKGAIAVEYLIGAIQSEGRYKMAFDVTANGETKGVTNVEAKLTAGRAYTNIINTTTLFGQETIAKDAKVKVSLISVPPPPTGQLWEGGPIWTEINLGESEVEGHPEYGGLYNFGDAQEAVSAPWRLPTREELEQLADISVCMRTWDDARKGWTFTGMGAYSANSIFLPSAGFDLFGMGRNYDETEGHYRSTPADYFGYVRALRWDDSDSVFLDDVDGGLGMSVRTVRDVSEEEKSQRRDEALVVTAEATFWLGPGCECCPWTLGEGVTAYIKDRALYLKGAGDVEEFEDDAPWAKYDDELDGVGPLSRAITVPASVAATLPISVEPPSIPDNMVLVTKESLQAAKAETVQIANGQIELGVSVLSNSDITASTAWAPVKFPEGTQIGLTSDGTKLIIPVPAAAQQGFMILQSGDAKIAPAGK